MKKEHASNIQGFNAFGFGYLGIIDNDEVQVFQKPINVSIIQLRGAYLELISLNVTLMQMDLY